MLTFNIPGYIENLSIHHLVLDFNGTIAVDGKLIVGVKDLLIGLSQHLTLHVITADTFGTVEREVKDIPIQVVLISREDQGSQKEKYVQSLNEKSVISIGNGVNDGKMLQVSAIGIIVMQTEGCSPKSLIAADVVCPDILSALSLLSNPLRLVATLRN
jgi:soluble P-type ATPase